jgi:hypothetical protein
LAAREAVDKNPDTVEMLRTRFVPVAVDVIVMHSAAADPRERAFYDKVTATILKNSDGGLQGHYCFTADGKVLGGQATRFDKTWEELTKAALRDFEELKQNAKRVALEEVPKATAVSGRTVPNGALVVRVSKKIIGGYQKRPGDRCETGGGVEIAEIVEKLYQRSTGHDNLWICQDEAEELAKGRLPESLKIRIARNLYDNTRSQGMYAFWPRNNVKKVEMTLADDDITGSVHVESPAGDRGYEGRLRGVIKVRDGKLTRFDLVAKGSWWEDEIRPSSPKKSIQVLAIAFRLNDNETTRRVPPDGALSSEDDYLR